MNLRNLKHHLKTATFDTTMDLFKTSDGVTLAVGRSVPTIA